MRAVEFDCVVQSLSIHALDLSTLGLPIFSICSLEEVFQLKGMELVKLNCCCSSEFIAAYTSVFYVFCRCPNTESDPGIPSGAERWFCGFHWFRAEDKRWKKPEKAPYLGHFCAIFSHIIWLISMEKYGKMTLGADLRGNIPGVFSNVTSLCSKVSPVTNGLRWEVESYQPDTEQVLPLPPNLGCHEISFTTFGDECSFEIAARCTSMCFFGVLAQSS